jgi:hypothetical protein
MAVKSGRIAGQAGPMIVLPPLWPSSVEAGPWLMGITVVKVFYNLASVF